MYVTISASVVIELHYTVHIRRLAARLSSWRMYIVGLCILLQLASAAARIASAHLALLHSRAIQ